MSDHALDVLRYKEADAATLDSIFQKACQGLSLSPEEIDAYRTETLIRLIRFYHQYDWTMQLHIHAYRNCNQAMFDQLGYRYRL